MLQGYGDDYERVFLTITFYLLWFDILGQLRAFQMSVLSFSIIEKFGGKVGKWFITSYF